MVLNEMSCEFFSEKMDRLKVLNQVDTKVSELESSLKAQFEEMLKQSKWSVPNFFFLIAGSHFVNDFVKSGYIDSQYLENINKNDNLLYRRNSLLFCDVDEVKSKFEKYCNESYPNFVKLAKENGIDEVDLAEPIRFLEIIEGNSLFGVKKTIAGRSSGTKLLVLSEISRKIRSTYHGVDIALAEQGISSKSFTTYNMRQMVEIFSARHKRIISEDNIVNELMPASDIGIYLKSEKYHVKAAATQFVPRLAAIEADIKEGHVNRLYAHPYEGLVRIVKDSEHPWLKRSVLRHLLNGGVIKILHPNKRERLPANHPDKYAPAFIFLEPSFAEYVLGDFKIIEVWPDQAEIEITINDLVFVKSEVDGYLQANAENDAKANNGKSNNALIFLTVYNTTIVNQIINQSVTLNSVTVNNEQCEEIHLSDEIIKDIDAGRKSREQSKNFGRKGAKRNKEISEETWTPILSAALEKAKRQPSKWSASGLATEICKSFPAANHRTLRNKIGNDENIKPYLAARGKSKRKKS